MTNIDSALKGRHITLQTKVHVVKAMVFLGFPDCSASKESACNAGDPNSIPGSGRSAGEWIGIPSGSAGKESACNSGDPGSIPGSGRSAGEWIGYPLQY